MMLLSPPQVMLREYQAFLVGDVKLPGCPNVFWCEFASLQKTAGQDLPCYCHCHCYCCSLAILALVAAAVAAVAAAAAV